MCRPGADYINLRPSAIRKLAAESRRKNGLFDRSVAQGSVKPQGRPSGQATGSPENRRATCLLNRREIETTEKSATAQFWRCFSAALAPERARGARAEGTSSSKTAAACSSASWQGKEDPDSPHPAICKGRDRRLEGYSNRSLMRVDIQFHVASFIDSVLVSGTA